MYHRTLFEKLLFSSVFIQQVVIFQQREIHRRENNEQLRNHGSK